MPHQIPEAGTHKIFERQELTADLGSKVGAVLVAFWNHRSIRPRAGEGHQWQFGTW